MARVVTAANQLMANAITIFRCTAVMCDSLRFYAAQPFTACGYVAIDGGRRDCVHARLVAAAAPTSAATSSASVSPMTSMRATRCAVLPCLAMARCPNSSGYFSITVSTPGSVASTQGQHLRRLRLNPAAALSARHQYRAPPTGAGEDTRRRCQQPLTAKNSCASSLQQGAQDRR
jgi:hypothetical protein